MEDEYNMGDGGSVGFTYPPVLSAQRGARGLVVAVGSYRLARRDRAAPNWALTS